MAVRGARRNSYGALSSFIIFLHFVVASSKELNWGSVDNTSKFENWDKCFKKTLGGNLASSRCLLFKWSLKEHQLMCFSLCFDHANIYNKKNNLVPSLFVLVVLIIFVYSCKRDMGSKEAWFHCIEIRNKLRALFDYQVIDLLSTIIKPLKRPTTNLI